MKLFKIASAFALSAFVASGVALAQTRYDEGSHFAKLAKPQSVETGAKIEVIEFFSFGCGHCRDFEPHLEAWMKKAPADVQVRRIPVAFQPAWKGLSKLYYTLESMGEAEKHASAVFEAIHRDNKKLNEPEVFFAWAESKGLDKAKVKSIYEGFAVDGKMRRADQFVKAYDVQFVPNIVVDGKYRVLADKLPRQLADAPLVIDYLIGTARKERK